jgi:hypothetical protein
MGEDVLDLLVSASKSEGSGKKSKLVQGRKTTLPVVIEG